MLWKPTRKISQTYKEFDGKKKGGGWGGGRELEPTDYCLRFDLLMPRKRA